MPLLVPYAGAPAPVTAGVKGLGFGAHWLGVWPEPQQPPACKTPLGLATVLSANLAFRSRGNPAKAYGFRLSFGVLVPGAMG